MGTISINPDADGDLHDASLHNDKFQTILNEINGNLDANNLANPDSFFPLLCGAGRSFQATFTDSAGDTIPDLFPYVGWTHTDDPVDRTDQMELGVPYVPTPVANGCNIITNSQFRNVTNNVMTLIGGSLIYRQTVAYNTAVVTLRVQRASSIASTTWADMATIDFSPGTAAPANISISTFTTTPVTNLGVNDFYRVLVQNNSATALSGTPGVLAVAYVQFTAIFKVSHTD
jgi:hypothetical protein